MATLVAPNDHSPHEDAEALRKAVKGWGTNEKGIISILGHRNAYQRQQIREAYQELYQEDLLKRLESELSGHFERSLYRWMLEPADREAVLCNVALKKHNNVDYNVIVEIASVHSPEELLVVRRAYHSRYKSSLEEDVAAHTTGHLRQLLVGLVSSFRYGGDEINARMAQSEAEILHDTLKYNKANYEEVIRILTDLTTRSKTQLVATFNRYKDLYATSISKKLLDEASDGFSKALHTAIRCINDSHKYYEKALRNALKRVGSDHEDAVTRVVVTRAERDLKDIKELYFKRNSVHLEDVIAKEYSGDYKKFLLALLGSDY